VTRDAKSTHSTGLKIGIKTEVIAVAPRTLLVAPTRCGRYL